jgi:hypothetical protein
MVRDVRMESKRGSREGRSGSGREGVRKMEHRDKNVYVIRFYTTTFMQPFL